MSVSPIISIAYVLEYTVRSRLRAFEPDVPSEAGVTDVGHEEVAKAVRTPKIVSSNPEDKRGMWSNGFPGSKTLTRAGPQRFPFSFPHLLFETQATESHGYGWSLSNSMEFVTNTSSI